MNIENSLCYYAALEKSISLNKGLKIFIKSRASHQQFRARSDRLALYEIILDEYF